MEVITVIKTFVIGDQHWPHAEFTLECGWIPISVKIDQGCAYVIAYKLSIKGEVNER